MSADEFDMTELLKDLPKPSRRERESENAKRILTKELGLTQEEIDDLHRQVIREKGLKWYKVDDLDALQQHQANNRQRLADIEAHKRTQEDMEKRSKMRGIEKEQQEYRRRIEEKQQQQKRRIDETKEFIETSKMGGEDVRATALQRYTIQEKVKEAKRQPEEQNAMFEEDTRLRQRQLEEAEAIIVAKERQRAMMRTQILELLEPQPKQIIDRSDKYGVALIGGSKGGGRGEQTGTGMHINVGQDSPNAKITDKQAQEIRTRYWAGKTGHGQRITHLQLSKEYGYSSHNAITRVINRTSYSHLPQVEYEPESQLEKLNYTAQEVIRNARKEGSQVIPNKEGVLLNKEGKIRLTDETILAQRKKPEKK